MKTQTTNTTTEFLHRATSTAGGLDPKYPTSSTYKQVPPACAHPFLMNGIKNRHQNWLDLTEIYERNLV